MTERFDMAFWLVTLLCVAWVVFELINNGD